VKTFASQTFIENANQADPCPENGQISQNGIVPDISTPIL
jgi:hypothetical protein